MLHPNYREFAARGFKLPFRLAGLVRDLARDLGQVSAVDVVLGLAEALPTGLYTGDGLERYVREILADPVRTDDFRELRPELYLAATDLDTCARAVFGAEGLDAVPISRAVSASSALPMIYKPVEIDGHEYVDGGLVSTTNLDVAVEAGARFIVVVNPLVPYIRSEDGAVDGERGARRVSRMGFPQIGYQAFKLLAHQRLHELARLWEERYPGVDIVLIEPEPSDELMFRTNVMNSRRGSRSRGTASSRRLRTCRTSTSATRRSAPGTASRSRPRPCRPWCGTSTRPTSRGRGERSSSRRPRRCCASRSRPPDRRRLGKGDAVLASPARLRQALAAWGWDIPPGDSATLERNRVLSIFPLKIGTPSSTHLTITSRRSRPASRASSVGVR